MKKSALILTAAALAALSPAYLSTLAYSMDDEVSADVNVEATVDVAADAEVVERTLADGTVVHIKGDHVFVVDAEGNETAAPDGTHTLSDGTTVETKDGMVVKADADTDAEMDHGDMDHDHEEEGIDQ